MTKTIPAKSSALQLPLLGVDLAGVSASPRIPQGLYPIPGSKAARDYDRYLFPPLNASIICEPFMGAATRSILYSKSGLQPILGEINPAQRAIALTLNAPDQYIAAYQEAYTIFWDGLERYKPEILSHAGLKNAQKVLGEQMPDACKGLSHNWKALCKVIFEWMQVDIAHPKLAGYYAFAIRAAFGNVMRLNPKGTHFNVSWHIDKLENACSYNPETWLQGLSFINWNPGVVDNWQQAIAAVETPSNTWLLLDPPYWADGKKEKMTACYLNHDVGTKGDHSETFNLAVESLQAGLKKEFPVIDCCNYYSDALDSAVRGLISQYGYHLQSAILGECNALGNSNGRLKHGERKDGRNRPVEVIYRITQEPCNGWGGKSKGKKFEQFTLLEG